MENRPDRTGRLLHGTMETFKWSEIISWLREEPQYQQKGHNALTLVKNEAMSIVVLCLHKEAQMREHHAPNQLTLTMLEGQINFLLYLNAETITTELTQGQILVLEEPSPHALIAVEESAFLLTIVGTKS